MNTTTVASLSVGDTVIDRDGMELRVTAKETRGRIALLTVEMVEAGILAVRPQPTTLRVSINSMVRVS